MKNEIKYLSHEDILSMNISFEFVVDVVERVLKEHADGFYVNPKKPAIHPDPISFFHAMPGYLPRLHAAGIKWVSGFSANAAKGLPGITGLTILNDDKNGFPIAVLDCSWTTGIRTAAVSAAAAKRLAPENAKVFTIIGTGIQGRVHAANLKKVVPTLETVKVFDVNPSMVESFKNYVASKTKLNVIVEPTPEAAIRGSDIVLTCTGKITEPVFDRNWVKKGALVLPIHSSGWTKDYPFKADKFIVDDWGQFKESNIDDNGYYSALPEPYAQLGEIIIGRKAGRESQDETILDHNYGLAIHDIALCKELLKVAEQKNIGTVLPYMDTNLDIV